MKRRPNAWRSFLWRVGIDAPRSTVVRTHVARVAADLETLRTAETAARALGLPGLYRSPACWGGDAKQPSALFSPSEWAARCQAASFEIAVALGAEAAPFVVEHAFGPFETLHGLGLRALFRLGRSGAVDADVLGEAVDRIEGLDPVSQEAALGGLVESPASRRSEPAKTAAPDRWGAAHRRIVERLERVVERARSVRTRLVVLDPLARLDPERARRFLPDLRGLLAHEDEHALDAALLVRALEPRDSEARDVLRRFADAHPDPDVRNALETRLRPPFPVRGGTA